MKAETQEQQQTVRISGKVLMHSRNSIKLWTPVSDEWIPLSQLSAEDRERVRLAASGDWVVLSIPAWLAKKRGLIS